MGIELTRRQHESSMHGGFISFLGVRSITRNASSPARARVSQSLRVYIRRTSCQQSSAHLRAFRLIQLHAVE